MAEGSSGRYDTSRRRCTPRPWRLHKRSTMRQTNAVRRPHTSHCKLCQSNCTPTTSAGFRRCNCIHQSIPTAPMPTMEPTLYKPKVQSTGGSPWCRAAQVASTLTHTNFDSSSPTGEAAKTAAAAAKRSTTRVTCTRLSSLLQSPPTNGRRLWPPCNCRSNSPRAVHRRCGCRRLAEAPSTHKNPQHPICCCCSPYHRCVAALVGIRLARSRSPAA